MLKYSKKFTYDDVLKKAPVKYKEDIKREFLSTQFTSH